MNDLSGAVWRKSSRSNGAGGQCVEAATNVAAERGVVGLRDSKDPDGPTLTLAARVFAAFVDHIKGGGLDL